MKKIFRILIFIILVISIIVIIQKYNQKQDTLPKVMLTGDILDIDKKNTVKNIELEYIENGKRKFKTSATIKWQGNSTLKYEKKNYTINLYDENYENKNKIDIDKGWGKQSKYCLKANYIDSIQARNIVSARLVAQMQDKYNLYQNTPNNGMIDGFPVEVYINNKYYGLYTWNIPKDEWTFGMDKKNENHIVMCAEDKNEKTSTNFWKNAVSVDGQEWSIEVGPNKSVKDVRKTFSKLNRVISFVNSSTDEQFKENISKYLNLDACLNYYCFINLATAIDNCSNNMLLVTYDGKVWYPTLYDLDSTWGLTWDGNSLISNDAEFPKDYIGGESVLWSKLERCFSKEIKQRYWELRNTVLSDENIINEFTEFVNDIPESAWKREHKMWKDIPSLKYDITQIKQNVQERGKYLDTLMAN